MRIGENAAGVEILQAIIAARKRIKDRISESNALANSGLAWLRLVKIRWAVVLFRSDLKIAREIGNLQFEADALSNLGKAFLIALQPETADDFFSQALEIARKTADRRVEAMTLWRMSLLQEQVGRHEQAINYADPVVNKCSSPHPSKRLCRFHRKNTMKTAQEPCETQNRSSKFHC